MGVKLLIGGAGTGKTQRCIKLLQSYLEAGRGAEVVFLLPNEEQVNEIKEMLLQELALPGFLDPRILTFADLSSRLVGRALRPARVISDVWRAAVLREIVRNHASGFYESARRLEGFWRHLGDLIRDLKQCLTGPDGLLRARSAVAGARGSMRVELEEKLAELATLYSEYNIRLRAIGREDREDVLWRASQALDAEGSLPAPASLLLVDGFSNFTPSQFSLLRALTRTVPETVITLCYQRGRGEVFLPTERMYEILRRWEPCDEEWLETNHRARNAPLLHLEQCLFSPLAEKNRANGEVIILEGYGRYNEAELVAEEIRRLVRDEGYSYDEVGIVVRSLETYREILPRVLRRCGVPCNMTRHLPLAGTPVARSLLAALDVAAGDWSGERVLEVVKGVYAGADRGAADAVENYVLARGVCGRDEWLRTWEQVAASEDLALRAARLKERTAERLLALEREIGTATSPEAAARAIREELRFLAEQLIGTQAPVLARVHVKALRAMQNLVDEVVGLSCVQDTAASGGAELASELRGAIANSRLQVPVGEGGGVRVTDVYTARVPEYRAVFVLGLLEGDFPLQPMGCPFLSDGERSLLRSKAGLPLEDRTQRAGEEPYLFYVALTRAAEKVYLAYPLVDEAGRVQDVSHFVEEVERLFAETPEGVCVRRGSGTRPLPALERAQTVRQLTDALATTLWQPMPPDETTLAGRSRAAALWNHLRRHLSPQERALLAGEDHPRQGASLCHPVVLAKLQERMEVFSATSLETYAKCPFAYFCERLLLLEERPIFEFTPLEEGAIYHAVLRALHTTVRERGGERLTDLGHDELLGLTRELLRRTIAGGYARYFTSRRMAVRRQSMEEVLERFVAAEREAQQASGLVPTLFELSFGSRRGDEPCDSRSTNRFLEIPIEQGTVARLRGRIDRVDLLERDGAGAGVVIDYKRGRSGPVVGRMREGADLQLGVYLLALGTLFNVEPIGGFYYSITGARKRGVFVSDEETLLASAGSLAKNDRLPSGRLADLLDDVQSHIGHYVESIRAGDISISPRECRWCAYRSMCRIDPVQAVAMRGMDD